MTSSQNEMGSPATVGGLRDTPVFTLQAEDGDARAGTLRTAHGEVPTPFFMPVATQGSVKAVDPPDLRSVGANIVLGNTYHLFLRPRDGADGAIWGAAFVHGMERPDSHG